MFIFSILSLMVLLFFVALNLGAAGASVLGIMLLIALWLRRKAEFWPLFVAMTFFLSGAGALGASWGTYAVVSQQTHDWGWPVLGWIAGYAVGGVLGALLGVFGVAWKRRRNLPCVEAELKARLRALKAHFSQLGFRQTLRVGAFSWRVAVGKRAHVRRR